MTKHMEIHDAATFAAGVAGALFLEQLLAIFDECELGLILIGMPGFE